MPDVLTRTVIDDALNEIEALLRGLPVSPAIRELRVRHGGLSRVVRGWTHVPPHAAQIAAMLDCVLELHGQVLRAHVPGRPLSRTPADTHPAASHVGTTRPPPRHDPSMRTTRPPPSRASDTPPSSPRG